ncbi:WAT1-related protein At2g39510 isoform X1 [Cornus florida]|uniref:WAT1-related protein At2g39510 isoform X1 n=1 Tax=Cornus florida TaxID=4283 RepID=UPI00289E50F1|nr:WAT1-related protein At2g39510 isoform X1 [Cornus florida]
MSKESSSQLFNRAKPFLGVVFLQFGLAGLSIIAKFALNRGMNHYTFAVYRHTVAFVVVAPFAMFFERKVRPTMTLSIFLKIMLLSLLEPVINQNLYYAGMKYTTATFAAAMCNIMPAIAFLMAWTLRLERVNLRRFHSQAKVVGTLVTVGGAMIMTLIKGPIIALPWTKETSYVQSADAANEQNHIKGSLMITASMLGWSSFYILQAITLKSYPAELSLTSLICMMGAVEGAILTLIVEKGNTAIWSIHWDTKLLSALYGGIISSGVSYYIAGVIMRQKGPVFVTSFNPLSMVIVAILGSLFLSEILNLGRVIGAVVIVIGLYLVVWGKSKDDQPSSKMINEQVLPIEQQPTKNGDIEISNHEAVNVSK